MKSRICPTWALAPGNPVGAGDAGLGGRTTQAAIDRPAADQAQVAAALNQIAQAEVSLRQSQSNLITAQNNLQTLLDGADEQDVRIAQAQVRQAQLNQLQAENNLTNSRPTAAL